MKKPDISIVGGDLRNYYLYKQFLENGYGCTLFGFDDYLKDKNYQYKVEAVYKSDLIIGPVPFSADNKNIYTPYSSQIISIEEFLHSINNSAKLISGMVKNSVKENYVDITGLEEFRQLNAVPTSEGILQILLNETDFSIHNSRVLITGFGRIGKYISKVLKGLGSYVTIASSDNIELTQAEIEGYKTINLTDLKNIPTTTQIIINTIPYIYFTSDILKGISKNILIVDVASDPGGVDKEYALRNEYKLIIAKGLPGKIAPKTVADYLYQLIVQINSTGGKTL